MLQWRLGSVHRSCCCGFVYGGVFFVCYIRQLWLLLPHLRTAVDCSELGILCGNLHALLGPSVPQLP
jgi:hypothetical protein